MYWFVVKNTWKKVKAFVRLDFSKEESPAIADLFPLTEKPVLDVANVDEAGYAYR